MNVSTNSLLIVLRQLTNVLLIILTMILGVLTFFAIMDIVMTIGVLIVVQSPEITTQQKYTISTIRNIWVFFGGCLLLGFLIVCIDYHTRRLNNTKTTRILIGTFIIEAIFIGISTII